MLEAKKREKTMGGKQAKFQEKQLRDFEELTPFNRAEISHAFSRFTDLYFKYYGQSAAQPMEDNPHHIRDNQGFANPFASLPVTFIMEELPELSTNPFKYRICKAFCISDNNLMNFTEFLDMVSSFSPKADLDKKIHHAFQIFDMNGDGVLSRSDLYDMMDMMTGVDLEPLTNPEEKAQWIKVRQWIVDGIFFECNKVEEIRMVDENETQSEDASGIRIDLNPAPGEEEQDGENSQELQESLTIEDFRYCMHRSPDFKDIFSFKI